MGNPFVSKNIHTTQINSITQRTKQHYVTCEHVLDCTLVFLFHFSLALLIVNYDNMISNSGGLK